MKRLIQANKNTAEEYDKVFFERQAKGVDWADLRRWKTLLRYYRGGSLIDLGCLDSRIPDLITEKYGNKGWDFFEKEDKTIILNTINLSGWEYWGLDYSLKALQTMDSKWPGISGVYYKLSDVYDTGFRNERFCYAVMGELIEHLEEPQKAIVEAMRILKPGGILTLSTPLNEAIEPGAVDKEHHLWSFTGDDVRRFLEPYGRVKIFILGSQWFPRYKYHFPNIIAWCWKT